MAQKNILQKQKENKKNKAVLLQGNITFHGRKDMIISDLITIIGKKKDCRLHRKHCIMIKGPRNMKRVYVSKTEHAP